MVRNWQLTV